MRLEEELGNLETSFVVKKLKVPYKKDFDARVNSMYILFTWKLFYFMSVESAKWGCIYIFLVRRVGMRERLKTIEVDDFLWYEVWKISKRKLLVEKTKKKKRRKLENRAIYLNKIKD